MNSFKQFLVSAVAVLILVCAGSLDVMAQSYRFKPGFDSKECDESYLLNAAFLDTTANNSFPGFLEGYTFMYRSAAIGLDNVYDLWLRQDATVIITLRGTTANAKSIMADFYCAMFPAQGKITLEQNKPPFAYKLATDTKAAVHGGFLISFAFIAQDFQPRLDELYRKGYRKFLVCGHSQGGALCYYVSAWLMQLRKDKVYPDISVKTYASAAPKMGNVYFVYDYDNAMHGEWSYSIVNTADPVPEMPLTTQQLEIDMNTPNPLVNLAKRFDDLPFFKRIVLKHAYNSMRKKARKSSEAYQKYLGGYAGKIIKGMQAGMVLPEPVKTTYFLRPGVPITLSDNEAYRDHFKSAPNYFHHGFDAYRYLLRQYYEGLPEMKKQ